MTEKDALVFPGVMLYLGSVFSKERIQSRDSLCSTESKTFVSQSACTPGCGQAWPPGGSSPPHSVRGFRLRGWNCLPTPLSSWHVPSCLLAPQVV